ncbi:MAG: D-alanyl-D-alanine carboxypeptidase/D-alanyl-D-alanine-endopeptidase [Bacteroidales bacterium]|jgi:D-alanyl-D-alanine carboxypeptidase/D-alanyl-D-alanine-endopeptidase (penicillin-binding protein 4)|nr:D-alanyl-D-alanine carboxypeptidase/D-alanyl-D-alanine-endopeptidase [Bacteroidales bacterium]
MKGKQLSYIFFVCWSVTAFSQTALKQNLDRLLADSFYQSATAGILVYDLTSGCELYGHNEHRLCRAASNMKLLTAATALHSLTEAYDFCTCLSYTGQIDNNGCLTGDLYLTGGFDPEFSTADLDSMMRMLKNAGIRQCKGRVYADVSMADIRQWGNGWAWDDDMEAFQPYLTPLPLNKGIVKLEVAPSSPTHPPVIRPEENHSFVRIENLAHTVEKTTEPSEKTLHFHRTCDENGNRIEVTGSISAKASPYKAEISLLNPTGCVLNAVIDKLKEQFPESSVAEGGSMSAPANAIPVGAIRHSLTEVVRQMNKESDNLNAEMLLLALAGQFGLPATTEKGIECLKNFIRQATGLDPENYRIVDGSGLSHANCLTPELLVAVLKSVYETANFSTFKSSLPQSGIDGTLKHRMKGTAAYQKIFAKTGTLTGISNLSGYLEASNGHLLAFSIMVQNFTIKSKEVNARYIDKICEQIAIDVSK